MPIEGTNVQSRRKFLKATGVAAGTVAIAGCAGDENGGSGEGGVAGQEDLESLSIQVAHTSPPEENERDHVGALEFQRYLEEASAGRIEVDIAPAAELGDEGEITDQVMEGALEVGAGTTDAHLSPYYPNYNLMAVPYVFPNIDIANQVIDSDFGQDLIGGFEDETGLNVVGWYDGGGFDSISVTDGPIESIDDLEGLDIRVMEAASHETFIEELGATPQHVAWPELYEALDQGVVDGQKNAIQTFITGNFQEVQDYILLDGHQYSFMNVMVNQSWFDDLDPVDQRLIEEAGTRWSMRSRKMNRIMREQGRQFVESHGVEVVDIDDDLREEMEEATQEPVADAIRDEVDDPGLVDELFDVVEDLEAEAGFDD